jgi:O-antigen ligase
MGIVLSPWLGHRGALRCRRNRWILVALGSYAALLCVSIATSVEPATSVRAITEVFNLATLWLALLLVAGEREARHIVDAVILLGTAQSGIGLVQYLAAGGFQLDQRIRGSLSHYMTFSGILLLAGLLLCSQLASRSHPGGRFGWRWLALVPINVALFGSLTRSAWVGLAAGLVVLLIFGRRRLLLAGAGAAVLVVLSALPHRAVVQRVTSIFDLSDATNYDRVCMAYAGWGMIRERPLLGQGPRMVQVRYPIYRHPTAPRYSVPHLHNSYLQLAAERGLPSLLAMLALVAVSLRRAWRDFRSQGGRSGPRADLYVGVFCSLAGFLVAGLFEDNWNDTEVQRIVLFLLALPFCLAQSRELDNEDPGGPEESTSPSLPPS